ncbi:Ubiquitin conjugation factor E4 A, partial [Clonorchis sinensis]
SCDSLSHFYLFHSDCFEQPTPGPVAGKMEVNNNPFAELLGNSECATKQLYESDGCLVAVTKTLESILLISYDKNLSFGSDGRPGYLLYVQPPLKDQLFLSTDSLDQVIFDRAQKVEIDEGDLLSVTTSRRSDAADALQTGPVAYLISCFLRAQTIKRRTDYVSVVEYCEQALVRQLLLFLMIDSELESTQNCDDLYKSLYDAASGGDPDFTLSAERLFMATLSQFEKDVLQDVDPNSECPASKLKPLKPLVTRLLDGLRTIKPNMPPSTPFGAFMFARNKLNPDERLLFCTQRKPFMLLSIWFSRFAATAQLLLEHSFPPNHNDRQALGFEFECGILGRLFVPSHLRTPQSPQMALLAHRTQQTPVGEFFTDEVPLKPVVEADQRNIWQLTKELDDDLHNLTLSLLRVGKQRPFIRRLFFRWIGCCLNANKARGQLAHTTGLMSESDTQGLASDGFLNNLTAVTVRLTGPLIHPTSSNDATLGKIWPKYASDPGSAGPIIPGLCEETRLTGAMPRTCTAVDKNVQESTDYPLLTELFFLAHASIRVGWTPLIAKHFETARQLHQLESQWEAHQSTSLGAGSDPRGQFLRQLIRERTSRYLEQSTSLSCVARLRDQLAFAVSTSQFLIMLAQSSFGGSQTAHTNEPQHGQLSDLPEFLMDNVVELVGYLRRAKDDFIECAEVADIPLEPLLELSILFMRHTSALANPHLRARLAEVLESLIPQRDDEAWNNQQAAGTNALGLSQFSFLRRQQLMLPTSTSTQQPGTFSQVVAALLTAFVSIELSPGTDAVGSAGTAADVLIRSASQDSAGSSADGTTEGSSHQEQSADAQAATVGFEEKFHYRRPMYACLRFWHGNPFFDAQFTRLETEALQHIEDATPPLFLQFLSLLVNDAIFLLDEAISLLAQLKRKEQEREAAGGRLATEEEEALFMHTGRLARHHIMLGLDTIAALRRVLSVCKRLITHPILVDRVACMLNYFLVRLVSPKQRDLTVRDKSAYGFRPDLLVIEICQIYCILALDAPSDTNSCHAESFRRAVVSDERSFTPDLLDQASNVLTRVASSPELVEKFNQAVTLIKRENVEKLEDDLDIDDAPDDYIDPIMGHLMEDPVKLPTSGHVVDRKTIYRHLLNDSTDPFNRQALSMSQVVPQEDLKAAIRAWVAEKRTQRQKS